VESAPPFSVDAVVTWVDGATERFRERLSRARAASATKPSPAAVATRRFRDLGLLPTLVEGLERHAPWLRRIHVITAGEPPPLPWSDKLRHVTHAEIFRHPTDLPTFHSSAIEANLAFIAELAEHFVYFNDDMFLMSPVSWSDFFDRQGRAHVFFESRRLFPPWARMLVERPSLHTRKLLTTVRAFARARPRTARAIGGRFGRFPRELHQPAPSRRSLLAGLWSDPAFGPLVRATSAMRFRDERALEIIYLQRLVALDTGLGVVARPPSHFELSLSARAEERAAALAEARRARPRLLCLHDNLPDDARIAREVSAELRSFFGDGACSAGPLEPTGDGLPDDVVRAKEQIAPAERASVTAHDGV